MSDSLTQPVIIQSDFYNAPSGGGNSFSDRAATFANTETSNAFAIAKNAVTQVGETQLGFANQVSGFLSQMQTDLFGITQLANSAINYGITIVVVLFSLRVLLAIFR